MSWDPQDKSMKTGISNEIGRKKFLLLAAAAAADGAAAAWACSEAGMASRDSASSVLLS